MDSSLICALRSMREVGKSYGQIAAALHVSENTVKSHCRRMGIRPLIVRDRCPRCGNALFSDRRKNRRFCSDACRYAWDYSHRLLNEKNAVSTRCACCKRLFFSYPSSHRKYCSHDCYIAERYGREVRHESGAV